MDHRRGSNLHCRGKRPDAIGETPWVLVIRYVVNQPVPFCFLQRNRCTLDSLHFARCSMCKCGTALLTPAGRRSMSYCNERGDERRSRSVSSTGDTCKRRPQSCFLGSTNSCQFMLLRLVCSLASYRGRSALNTTNVPRPHQLRFQTREHIHQHL